MGNRTLRFGFLATLLLTVVATFFAVPGRAEIVPIGNLIPFPEPGVTPRVDGIAFDGTPNALVFDRWSWVINRVSVQNASVLETHAVTPHSPIYVDELVYDKTSGDYFTRNGNNSLVRINGTTYTPTNVGFGIGNTFGAIGMSIDTTGQLWLLNGDNGGELWKVNKETGFGEFQTAIATIPNRQLTSFLIDGAGNFITYSLANSLDDPGRFDRINPLTGARTFLTDGLIGQDYMGSMAFDPVTKNYYGIVVSNVSNTNTLVQITGIPEPSSIAIVAAGLLGIAIAGRKCQSAKTV